MPERYLKFEDWCRSWLKKHPRLAWWLFAAALGFFCFTVWFNLGTS
ncbi:hypothetical protein [Succinatimonas hippei]|nr:hypothetical protein [Succinatimonas hippei]